MSKGEKWDEGPIKAIWLDIVQMMSYDVVFSMSWLIYLMFMVHRRPWVVLINVDRMGRIERLSTI